MKNNLHGTGNTELATGFSIRDYKKACENSPPDRDSIAEAIRRRFTERYITPAMAKPRHGFTMMAVSCLMIEALEGFRQGWKTSKGRSEKAFCNFFNTFEPFNVFREHAKDFYAHIRCGILHEAESRGGWRILRDRSPLFDTNQLTVNAECFLNTLKQVLDGYCDGLKTAGWEESEWKNARIKLDTIVRNCRRDK